LTNNCAGLVARDLGPDVAQLTPVGLPLSETSNCIGVLCRIVRFWLQCPRRREKCYLIQMDASNYDILRNQYQLYVHYNGFNKSKYPTCLHIFKTIDSKLPDNAAYRFYFTYVYEHYNEFNGGVHMLCNEQSREVYNRNSFAAIFRPIFLK
jgi:hypothetical protein